MSSAVRGVIFSIDYDISLATSTSLSWIITTFAADVEV